VGALAQAARVSLGVIVIGTPDSGLLCRWIGLPSCYPSGSATTPQTFGSSRLGTADYARRKYRCIRELEITEGARLRSRQDRDPHIPFEGHVRSVILIDGTNNPGAGRSVLRRHQTTL